MEKYIVTGTNTTSGKRKNISKPLSEEKAISYKAELDYIMTRDDALGIPKPWKNMRIKKL